MRLPLLVVLFAFAEPWTFSRLRKKKRGHLGGYPVNPLRNKVAVLEEGSEFGQKQGDANEISDVGVEKPGGAAAVGSGVDASKADRPAFEGYARKCSKLVLLPTGVDGECTFNLDEDNDYLPDRALIEKIQKTRVEPWTKDASDLFELVQKLQNPAQCKKPESAHHNHWHLALIAEHGFAYNIYMFAHLCSTHWVQVSHLYKRIKFSSMICCVYDFREFPSLPATPSTASQMKSVERAGRACSPRSRSAK